MFVQPAVIQHEAPETKNMDVTDGKSLVIAESTNSTTVQARHSSAFPCL